MSPRARLLVAVVSTGLLAYIAAGALVGRVIGDTSYGQLAIFNEVIRLVLDYYVEPVDIDRPMAGANIGLTDALDGDSAYLDAEELLAYNQPRRESEADIGVILTRRYTFLMVAAPRSGSPAEHAGIRAGDILKAIDGRHTRTLTATAGERLLRGDPGSVVKLTVLRPGSDPLELSVVRERPQPVASSARVLSDGIGYLKISEITPRTSEEAHGELDTFKRSNVRRLVLDLRGCAFGQFSEAANVAELFLKGGTVAKLSGRSYAEQVLTAETSHSFWEYPMTVLVNGSTLGPAEVVAAALLERDRAPVVGEHTFGRAGIQRLVPIGDGALLLTVAKYNSPKGNPIHGRGVEPSVAVETPEPGEAGGADPILEKALELLRAEVKKAA